MPPADETRPGELDNGHRRRKLLQFSPEINTGHLLQILVLLVGGLGVYGAWQAERATSRLEVEQIKRDASADAARTKESISELKAEVRAMQSTLLELNLNVVRMNAQMGSKESAK